MRLFSYFFATSLILLKHFKETLQEVVSSVGKQVFSFSKNHTLKYCKVIYNNVTLIGNRLQVFISYISHMHNLDF